MELREDVMIIIGFWALYGPMSLINWYNDKSNYIDLIVIFLIGVGLLLLFLGMRKLVYSWSRKINRKLAKKEEEEAEEEENAVNPKDTIKKEDVPSTPSASLNNLFKEDFKEEAQDLD